MNEQSEATEGTRSTPLCPNCQAEIAEGDNFCHVCGTRFASSPEVPLPQPRQLAPQPPAMYVRPLKDRSIALILEILPALLGFLGFGWIYAGEVNTGVTFLVGYLVVVFVFAIFDVFSSGICCFLTLPLQIVIVVISVSRLNKHIKAHPELFGQ
jgi:TM2 domain-containing membrane protein YozV